MSENVKKAVKIDELVADGMTTSMVDDVFYVLQSCTRRAISTSNLQSVLQIINHTAALLNNDFSEALERKIREPSLFLKIFSAGVAVLKAGTEASTALNNVDVSAEYVGKLKHDIEEHSFEVRFSFCTSYFHYLQESSMVVELIVFKSCHRSANQSC